MVPSLYDRLFEMSRAGEHLPLETLFKYLAEATHRCERAFGERPTAWSILFPYHIVHAHEPSWTLGAYSTMRKEEIPQLEPEIEALLKPLGASRLRFFLKAVVLWEMMGEKDSCPYEPMAQICRHGGSMRIAGDGLLDLEDYAGKRAGIPIASTFKWERLS